MHRTYHTTLHDDSRARLLACLTGVVAKSSFDAHQATTKSSCVDNGTIMKICRRKVVFVPALVVDSSSVTGCSISRIKIFDFCISIATSGINITSSTTSSTNLNSSTIINRDWSNYAISNSSISCSNCSIIIDVVLIPVPQILVLVIVLATSTISINNNKSGSSITMSPIGSKVTSIIVIISSISDTNNVNSNNGISRTNRIDSTISVGKVLPAVVLVKQYS
uniref:Uncharacterized protein n=1 Tax=Glossina palpalis gambiensis TaxID=67801 RepID=A0A1B0BYJ8_9MUSC